MPKYHIGDQIAYIPTHAHGDINADGVEFGFVMYDYGDACACRFWRGRTGELRTLANSEMTYKFNLIPYALHPLPVVQAALDQIKAQEKMA